MPEPDKTPDERQSTDASLRIERDKTDAQLARNLGALRATSDALVAEARNKADAVLAQARDREDEKLAASGVLVEADLETARARADAVLTAEHARADEAALSARARRKLALASLLAHERRDTDLRLEVERTRADEAVTSREDFMAIVSHDLRSLLGGIALSADLVNELAEANEPIAKTVPHADSIQRFCGRMNRLVGDLMDVASIEAGRLSIFRELSDPALLVRDSLDAFQPAARLHEISLAGEIEDGIAAIAFDPTRILQVLTNLVGNALKFTPKGGRITMRVASRAQEVEFAVSDTGGGIPQDRLTQIFDRFYQTLEHDRRGLGLGLFIVKSIVEAHGGRVWAESTPGVGSTFSFTVPRVDGSHRVARHDLAPAEVTPGAVSPTVRRAASKRGLWGPRVPATPGSV